MLRKFISASVLLGCAFTSQAGLMTTKQNVSSDWIDTNFSQYQLNFNKFDTLGGTRTLKKIHFELFGETKKDFFAENTSNSSNAEFDVELGTKLKLTTVVGLEELVSTLPEYIGDFSLAVFDGQSDYLGASGLTARGLYASKGMQSQISQQHLLSMFTGSGSIATLLGGRSSDALRTSGGNISSVIKTQAAATASIQYEYELNQVSAPASFGLFGLALVGLMFGSRRR